MSKTTRLSRIKSLHCYTISEAAEITGVCTRTVGNWIKAGLPVMGNDRPTLIRGDDLRAFLKAQRASRKTPLALHEFYCLKCRAAREAGGGFAECEATGTRLTLTAICATCETILRKPIASRDLSSLGALLDIAGPD